MYPYNTPVHTSSHHGSEEKINILFAHRIIPQASTKINAQVLISQFKKLSISDLPFDPLHYK
jgi:hypothetical protein